MKDYIPCPQHWKDMFEKYPFYNVISKFPVKNIRRKKLVNQVDRKEVFFMLLNFEKEAWMPIMLDENSFLIDGQHRLELARQMGLLYIDVVVRNDKLMR